MKEKKKKEQEGLEDEFNAHLGGSVPVRLSRHDRYFMSGKSAMPIVKQESVTPHLPRSCLEMKMNKLSVGRIDQKWKQV